MNKNKLIDLKGLKYYDTKYIDFIRESLILVTQETVRLADEINELKKSQTPITIDPIGQIFIDNDGYISIKYT